MPCKKGPFRFFLEVFSPIGGNGGAARLGVDAAPSSEMVQGLSVLPAFQQQSCSTSGGYLNMSAIFEPFLTPSPLPTGPTVFILEVTP